MTQVSLFSSSGLGFLMAPKSSREPSGGDLRSAFILVGRFEEAMVMTIYFQIILKCKKGVQAVQGNGESAAR